MKFGWLIGLIVRQLSEKFFANSRKNLGFDGTHALHSALLIRREKD